MKKILVLLVATASLFCFMQIKGKEIAKVDDLLLENIDAIADAEIIIGPFCIETSGMCYIDPSNGFFIRGYRQYF